MVDNDGLHTSTRENLSAISTAQQYTGIPIETYFFIYYKPTAQLRIYRMSRYDSRTIPICKVMHAVWRSFTKILQTSSGVRQRINKSSILFDILLDYTLLIYKNICEYRWKLITDYIFHTLSQMHLLIEKKRSVSAFSPKRMTLWRLFRWLRHSYLR